MDENQQTQRIEIVDRIAMGRSCKGIDPQRRILLKYPLVSRDHAEINWTAGHLQITDNSMNGTWVNDVRMAAGSSKELSDGDTIRIGYSVLRVVYPKSATDAKQNHTETQLTMVSSLEEVVTSLMADMRGFSAYCQTHASADVYGMINQIFDQFSKIIEDFEVTVKDYAGVANKEVAENILICSHTAELVENQLDLKDLGMLPIRGREGQERILALQGHVI